MVSGNTVKLFIGARVKKYFNCIVGDAELPAGAAADADWLRAVRGVHVSHPRLGLQTPRWGRHQRRRARPRHLLPHCDGSLRTGRHQHCINMFGMFQFLLKKKEVHQTRATSVTSLVRTDSVSRMMYTDNTSP